MPSLLQPEEKKEKSKACSDAIKKCKTIEELRAAWKIHYMVLGHKQVGRLFLGTVDEYGEKKTA